jgi:Fur family ferric uptake transcriptional regulator
LKRNTTQRNAIEQVFQQHEQPLGVEEVLAYGRDLVDTLNQATVYRNLNTLIDDGWLERFYHPEVGTLYERAGKAHHHHFLCRKCHHVFDVPGCTLKVERAAPKGFMVQDHDIFLFGVCPSCRKGKR